MFLARKISRAKWEPGDDLNEGELPADAVTVDLRTQDNALSFWRCENASKDHVERAALAIAAAAERIDKLDVVWVAEGDLQTDELHIEQTDGRTPIADMVANHIDVQRLDYTRLGKVASRVARALAEQNHRRLTKKSVRRLLVAAVQANALSLDGLDEKLRQEVSLALETVSPK